MKYLRAMLSTLVLFRTRCGCLERVEEEEQAGEGGMEESVWTLKHKKSGMLVRHILSAAPEEEEEVLQRGWVG